MIEEEKEKEQVDKEAENEIEKMIEGEDKIEEEDGGDGHLIYRDENLYWFFQCPRER